MKRMLLAGAALLSLSCCNGCGLKTQGPPGPPPPRIDPCATTNGVCAITVTPGSPCSTGSCATLTPDSRHVGDHTKRAKDVVLLWTFSAPGYAFCPGDAVTFAQDPDAQFSDNYATDDGNGGRDTADGAKKHYRWQDRNSKEGGPYKYRITFHDSSCKNAYQADPDIVNDM